MITPAEQVELSALVSELYVLTIILLYLSQINWTHLVQEVIDNQNQQCHK